MQIRRRSGHGGTPESRRLTTRACMVVVTAGAQCQVGRGRRVPPSPRASSFSITPTPFGSPHRMQKDGPDLAATAALTTANTKAPSQRSSRSFTQQIAPSPLAASPTNRRLMHQLFCPKVGVEPPRTGDHGPHATDTSQQRRNGIGLSAAGTRPGVHSARSGRSAERGRPARHNKGSLNDAFRPQTARLAHISLVVRRTRAKMRLQQLTRVPSQIDGR